MRSRFSRLMMLLCVLVLAVCLCAATVSAAKPTTDPAQGNSGSWIHPMEAGEATAPTAGALAQTPVAGADVPEPSYYCNNIEEYFALIRQQFAARSTYVVVGFRDTVVYDWNDLNDRIVEEAYKHTGIPDQGDYIYWNILQFNWNSYRASVSGGYKYRTAFTVNYRSTADQERQVDAAVDSLLDYLALDGYSDYAKARRVYDYMVSNITYDYDGLALNGGGICHTTYSAIVLKNTVCQGYASLYYRLMLELGLDCRAIGGDANDYGETGPNYPSGVGDNHCWNIVKVDGKWYNLDSTWDANAYESGYGICHDWFLVCNANFPRHFPWSERQPASFWAVYPIASSDYSYTASPNGWYQKGGQWHYGQNGYDRAGWLADGGKWYYLDNSGALKTGWLKDGDYWFYLQPSQGGAMATGIITIGGKTHEFSTSGVWKGETTQKQQGWVLQDGIWYYYQNGVKKTGWFADGGKWYYFASNGAMVKGWLQQGSKWYYFNASGVMVTGTVTIDGKPNKFDANGVWQGVVQTSQQNGWVKQGSYWYYYQNGTKKTGWLQLNAKWYYFDASGAMKTGWQKLGGTWYFFDASGVMKTGWYQEGGKWYYFKADGAMVTGTVTIGGKPNKFDANGVWLGEVTQNGWVQQGGKWYYYQNGAKKTGWLSLNGDYYYFNADGVMKTGWLKDGGEWYYMDANGVMVMGDYDIGGKTYYFDHNTGAMWTDIWGYDSYGNYYYYCVDGYMYKNGWYTIRGVSYYFEADGRCPNHPWS